MYVGPGSSLRQCIRSRSGNELDDLRAKALLLHLCFRSLLNPCPQTCRKHWKLKAVVATQNNDHSEARLTRLETVSQEKCATLVGNPLRSVNHMKSETRRQNFVIPSEENSRVVSCLGFRAEKSQRSSVDEYRTSPRVDSVCSPPGDLSSPFFFRDCSGLLRCL